MQPVIDAIELIRRHRDSRQLFFTLEEAPIDDVVTMANNVIEVSLIHVTESTIGASMA